MSKRYFTSLNHGFLTQKSGAKTSFFVEEKSPKPLAVLIHGFGGNAFGLTFLAEEMARDWRILILEMPNHGRSDFQPIETAADFKRWNDEIITQIEAEFGEISLIVCHSMSCFSVSEQISTKIPTALINPVFATSNGYNLAAELLFRSQIFAFISNFWLWSPIKATFLIRHWSKKSVRNVFLNIWFSQPSLKQILYQAKMSKIVLEKPLLNKQSQAVKFLIIGERDGMSHSLSDEWKNNFFPETTVVNLKTGHLLPLEIPKTTAEIFNQK